jgi:hypothetical protein
MYKKTKHNLRSIIKIPLIIISKIILFIKNHTKDNDSYKHIYKRYEKENLDECYNYFKNHLSKSLLINQIEDIRIFSIETALKINPQEGHFLEFGVFDGESSNLFSKKLGEKKIYGFDSFQGLKDNWVGHHLPSGTFDLNGEIPNLEKNVIPVKGWVQDTLPIFLKENNILKVNFLHMDLDTYESTKFVLNELKPYLKKNSIILFDQLYNYPGWKEGEFKALNEVFKETDYKYLAFGKYSKQVLINIL